VLRGLSLVAVPSPDTVKLLLSLQQDPELGQQATFGLGTELHRLRQRDAELAKTILSALIGELAASNSGRRTAQLLIALGNAGHPDSLAVIVPYLHAPEEPTRAAAAQALRRIPGPKVDALLAAACADSSAAVRRSAVDAVSERSSSAPLVSAVARILDGEPALPVRALAVHLAARWLTEAREALAPHLATIAEKDENAELRQIAARALASR
jgi:HEAT repeat protein